MRRLVVRPRLDQAVIAAALLSVAGSAAAAPTPGYPERVLQWQVQPGETCDDIATSLYGAAKHASLLLRYNDIRCGSGLRLPPGTVLVVPETVTELPPASLHSTTPTVKARPPSGEWSVAVTGMPLYQEYSVNTLKDARADIRFRDRTRILLAEHTLVIIYETAGTSAITSQRPPSVELQEGEVQAGLAVLSGRAVDVTATGGGRVSAASRDAVLRRSGERTTVSVFDGSAGVESAGNTVKVPKNFGSSFIRKKPPTPPRPLPPAPEWSSPSSTGVLLAEPGAGRLEAGWSEVPKAVRYRLEVARDAAFTEIIVREETPADVRRFRGEQMPAGRYYFRVRALDGEDFLGIASSTLQGLIVDAAVDGGHVRSGEIEATPYSSLQLSKVDDLELALDDHEFGKAPTRIDLLKQRPSRLRLRLRGSLEVNEVALKYTPVAARFAVERLPASPRRRVRVTLEGVTGIDVAGRVAPHLYLQTGAKKRQISLVSSPGMPAVWASDYEPEPRETALLVLEDGRGSLLGKHALDAPAPRPSRLPRIGPSSAPAPLAPAVDVPWWSPSLPKQASIGIGAQLSDRSPVGQGIARASTSTGDLGLTASIALRAFGQDAPADSSAWLGAAYRFVHSDSSLWALSLRAGLPMQSGGPATRLEPSFAVGTELGRFSWLGDFGGRFALGDPDELPRWQAFALFGGAYAPRPWLRLYSLVDAHLLEREQDARARAGLGFGFEVGEAIFSGLGLHASPWDDSGGFLFGQLTVGVRER